DCQPQQNLLFAFIQEMRCCCLLFHKLVPCMMRSQTTALSCLQLFYFTPQDLSTAWRGDASGADWKEQVVVYQPQKTLHRAPGAHLHARWTSRAGRGPR